MIGEIRNGERVHVEFPGYDGKAGVRIVGELVEVAFLGTEPRSFPIEGKIAGRPLTPFESAGSRNPGMVVLRARYIGTTPEE